MKILVSDPLSAEGISRLEECAQVDQIFGLNEKELIDIIGAYDALVVRSGTKVTAPVIDAGVRLKVIGRAGVGVDNIDVERATERGIIVINAPEGNTISAAEHTIAMLTPGAQYSAARRIERGRWEKQFMGVELSQGSGIIGWADRQ